MGFLSWLESTGYSEWILTSTIGWPLMLTIHAIGIAIIVGLMFSLNLRVLGYFGTIPYTALYRLMSIAWIGIVLNIVTGLSIFMTMATMYVTSLPFIVKIVFVILGIANLHYMQKVLKRDAAAWQSAGTVPQLGIMLAATSLVFWIIAVVAGRMIAYI